MLLKHERGRAMKEAEREVSFKLSLTYWCTLVRSTPSKYYSRALKVQDNIKCSLRDAQPLKDSFTLNQPEAEGQSGRADTKKRIWHRVRRFKSSIVLPNSINLGGMRS